MKKNLKSVISFVIALALSLSSMSALAAVSYDDVPADASYAEAVANLTAIGVVEGYGDGKFNPDNNITRAEVAAMVVRAIAQNESAISSQGTTNFTDVAADHWASGYINVASRGQQAFINGMGDGTFAPEENVTYSQAVKMVVAAIGYNEIAMIKGGWPTGYMTTADELKITAGIKANIDEAASRAVVAQLINNAIDTPLLVLKTYSPTDPEYQIQDGTDGKDYETTLTSKHNIYKVEGRVSGTKRAGASVDADEILFTIESTKNYDGEVVVKSDADPIENVSMYIGETDVDQYLGVYSKLMVKIDEDEDPIVLSCVPSGKNTTTELDAGAWDDEYYDSVDEALEKIFQGDKKGQIWYYANDEKTGKSSRYYLDDEFKLYVNGVEIVADEDSVEAYILENSTGKVTLVDTPSESSNSTDGRYDSIFVSYYATGIVESVGSNGKVYFDKIANAGTSATSVEFDEEDEDLEFTITFNGEEIEYTDLQEKDVLSIAYDITGAFKDSEFYDVLVSRDVVEGKVNETNDEDNEIIVDGTTYGMVSDVLASYDKFDLGTSYTIYLDAFGNVVDYEKLASTVKYGIISRARHSDEADEDRVVLYDTTATKKTFAVTDNFVFIDSGEEKDFDALEALMDSTADAEVAAERVVEYKTNNAGELKEVKLLNGSKSTTAYAEKSSKLGTLKFDDNTVMISVEDKDFSVVTVSALADDNDYTAYGFDKEDGIYGLIVITDGIGSTTSDSRFAVVEKVTQGTNEDGDECDKLSLYTAGSDELQIVYGDGTGVVDFLNKGDVIIYTTNAAGVIEDADDVEVIFSAGTSYVNYAADSDYDATGWYDALIDTPSNWSLDNEKEVEVRFGPVIDRSSNDITIGEVVDGKTATEDCEGFKSVEALDYANDVAVYVYDYNNASSKRLSVGTVSSVAKTVVPSSIMEANPNDEDDKIIINWADAEDEDVEAVYALVKIVDEEVTDVFVIIPKD